MHRAAPNDGPDRITGRGFHQTVQNCPELRLRMKPLSNSRETPGFVIVQYGRAVTDL